MIWRRLRPSAVVARPIERELIGRAAQDAVIRWGMDGPPPWAKRLKSRLVALRVRQALSKPGATATAAAAGIAVGIVVGLVLAAVLLTVSHSED